MQSIHTPAQVERLKREAKKRSRASDLTHSQALDIVACEHGFKNWSLLARHSELTVSDAVSVEVEPYPGGRLGSYLVRILVRNRMRYASAVGTKEAPQFELPFIAGWMFHPSTQPQHVYAPFLRPAPLRGVFVDGEWQAILATNGVQQLDVDQHIRLSLLPAIDQLQAHAAAAVERWCVAKSPDRGHRLVFTRPQRDGVPELTDERYSTLEAAKSAQVPTGCVKVGISTDDGWWHYQEQFGWQVPAER